MELSGRQNLCFFLLFVLVSQAASFELGYVAVPVSSLLSRFKRQSPNEAVYDAPKIADLHILSNVVSRFATVIVSSKVVNVENVSLEAEFTVQIPDNAFISNFTMVINDTFYVGKVMEKVAAQKKYNEAKEKGQSAGQVKHKSRDLARGMDVFTINVNVAKGSDVHFQMMYQQILDRRLGQYEHRIMVQPLQIVENLTMDLTYDEHQSFSFLNYRLPNSTKVLEASSTDLVLTASPDKKKIVYTPSVQAQRAMNTETGLNGEFVVQYDVNHELDGGNIIYSTENDYFVHFFAVDKGSQIPVLPKNIMFVIDISGSMGGQKIVQTREAMKSILNALGEGDYFNMLLFDDHQILWQKEGPLRASGDNIRAAQEYVDHNVNADGGTDIHGALVEGVKRVTRVRPSGETSNIIMFLTDGQPTAGVTNIKNIRDEIKRINENRVVIFSLGFGRGVNFEFLQQVSWESGGFAWKIYEDNDAAEQLTTFFKDINYPLMLNLEFKYSQSQVSDLTITQYRQFFSGTEVRVAGKRKGDVIDASVEGTTTTEVVTLVVPEESKMALQGVAGQFTEKMWAYMTIKRLLRDRSIAETEEAAESLKTRALQMSLDYNFVTPLTSLIIVQEEKKSENIYEDMLSSVPGRNRNIMYSRIPSRSCSTTSSFATLVCTASLMAFICRHPF